MPFTLKNNNTDYQFDTDGSVVSAGAAGTWSVNADNQIVFKPQNGATIAFPVGWTFIDNQLWLSAGGQKIFNFHAEGFPDYRVAANQIQVSPRVPASPFAFTLNAGLSLNADIDLVVKIGTIESAIVGTLEDTQGQFIYRFKDPTLGQEDALIFAGRWVRDDKVEGEIHLNFVYTVAGAEQTIAIPQAFDVNPFTNSLRLRYEKAGKSRLLELAGELKFKNNTTIIFNVRKSGGNGTSEIAVDFRLNGTGKTIKTLELTVLKSDGSDGSKTLQIGGTLSAKIGNNGLTIGFRYAKVSGGTAGSSIDIAVDGKFSLKNGEIVFSYKKTGTTQTISLVAKDLQFGSVLVNGGFSINQDGTTKTVRGFVGLQW